MSGGELPAIAWFTELFDRGEQASTRPSSGLMKASSSFSSAFESEREILDAIAGLSNGAEIRCTKYFARIDPWLASSSALPIPSATPHDR